MKIVRISSTWCPSCLVTKKYFDDLKEKYKDIEYIEYDYDIDDISKYGVKDILPVVIVFKDDMEIMRLIGENNLKEIEKELGEV